MQIMPKRPYGPPTEAEAAMHAELERVLSDAMSSLVASGKGEVVDTPWGPAIRTSGTAMFDALSPKGKRRAK